ncbi:MAG: NADH-quinone oxidoreductase subunit J [Candidatus Riflebacteria bacterium]|nr:NADH-quinone oxidoreductase subunit J [Candidatus Riflebacteria bacterium]
MISNFFNNIFSIPFGKIIYQATFYLLAFQALFSALMVVTLRNLVHNVLFLASTMLMVAGLFLFLDAEFLAMVQIFLYVGGITVLFLFAIMLTSGISDKKLVLTNKMRLPAGILMISLFSTVLLLVFQTKFPVTAGNLSVGDVTNSIGVSLLSKYVLPFEIVSILLLMALIGSILLAKEEK